MGYFSQLRFAPEEPVGRRTMAGAIILSGAFGVFVPIILLMLLLGGPEQIDKHGTLWRVDLILVLYPLGAAVAGAIVGALLPLTRSRVGACAVGVIALVPWAAGISLCADRGYAHWTGTHTALAALTALPLGLAFGAGLYAGDRRRRRGAWVQRPQRATSRVGSRHEPPAA